MSEDNRLKKGIEDNADKEKNGEKKKKGIKMGIFYGFALAVIFLFIVGVLSPELGIIYYIGLSINIVLFIIQHKMISADNLKNVKIIVLNEKTVYNYLKELNLKYFQKQILRN